ncbi:MAG TPA: hypothetical protein VIH36_15815 [Casimicrobiaceae bacterium]|jgi:hypothetical protein
MTKLTKSLLALGLAGVLGTAFACGDAPMSMKDASVAQPTVVASAAKAAPVQTVAKTAPVTTVAATPATKVADQTASRR